MRLILSILLFVALAWGQSYAMEATTPELQSNDMSFVQEKQKDARIGGGTLIKVRSAIPNLQFFGWVIKSEERRPGEYWVFLETAGGKVQVAADGGHSPVDIVIEDNTPEQVYVVEVYEEKGSPSAAASANPPLHIDLPTLDGRNHPGFDMVFVKNGRFEMGATPEQVGADGDEKKVHRVLISRDFYIGQTEVTQSLWEFVMGNNPSQIKEDGVELPVENITWEDARDFCRILSRLTGKTFRLPTEAEWEYAARGGHEATPTLYSGSNDPNEVGWYKGTSNMRIMPVMSKKPNELGIYDMSGNVYELCEDSKTDGYPDSSVTDPMMEKGPTSNRVRRGGSWDADANSMRVAFRRRVPYDNKQGCHPGSGDTGMRLVMEK